MNGIPAVFSHFEFMDPFFSNFEALVRPLLASARAGDRPGHIELTKYLCPTR
jgi:hypothetical protein